MSMISDYDIAVVSSTIERMLSVKERLQSAIGNKTEVSLWSAKFKKAFSTAFCTKSQTIARVHIAFIADIFLNNKNK